MRHRSTLVPDIGRWWCMAHDGVLRLGVFGVWLMCIALLGTHSMDTFAASKDSAATQVHKCAQADGRILYTQHACDAPGTTTLRLDDRRTQDQIKSGKAMQQRNEDLGERMRKDRRHMERQTAGGEAMALTRPDTGKAHKAAKAAKPSVSDARKASKARDPRAVKPLRRADFTARVPGSQRKRQSDSGAATSQPN